MSASLLSGVAVVLACAAATVQASDPKYDYKVSQRPMHQDDAKQWCSDNFDGWLATISDGDEKRDVEKAVSESGIAVDYFWLSLERKQNPVRWEFANGAKFNEEIDSTRVWSKNEPNFFKRKEYCAAVTASTGLWNDVKCNKNYYAVCTRNHIANPFDADKWHRRVEDASTNCYYKYFNHVLYKKLTPYVRKNWWDAEGWCNSQKVGKAHLAVIDTQAENDFVENLIYNTYDDLPNRPVWLGARRENDEWKEWNDGSKMSFLNWIPGEPNFGIGEKGYNTKSERCMQMSHGRLANPDTKKNTDVTRGKWNDADCNMHRGYMCELCSTKW